MKWKRWCPNPSSLLSSTSRQSAVSWAPSRHTADGGVSGLVIRLAEQPETRRLQVAEHGAGAVVHHIAGLPRQVFAFPSPPDLAVVSHGAPPAGDAGTVGDHQVPDELRERHAPPPDV